MNTEGAVWFMTGGVGVGDNPKLNEIIGHILFGKMHSDVRERVLRELVGDYQGQ
jgi:hypothetical protein